MKNKELIERFVEDVCAGKTNETPAAYRAKLKRLADFLQNRPITAEELKNFRLDLLTRKEHYRGRKMVNGGLSVFTVRSVLTTTRHFCHWLYENKYTEVNLAPSIKIPTQPQPQPKAIDKETFEALLNAAGKETEKWLKTRNLALLYWLRDTGGRLSGALNATVGSVNFDKNLIETYEKGKSSTKFISPVTAEALKDWLECRAELKPKNDALFISAKSRQGITRSGIYGLFNHLARTANISARMNPHSFRHAFARDLLLGGGELTQLAGILGHSSTVVTSTYYTRWNIRELQAAHDKYTPVQKGNHEI